MPEPESITVVVTPARSPAAEPLMAAFEPAVRTVAVSTLSALREALGDPAAGLVCLTDEWPRAEGPVVAEAVRQAPQRPLLACLAQRLTSAVLEWAVALGADDVLLTADDARPLPSALAALRRRVDERWIPGPLHPRAEADPILIGRSRAFEPAREFLAWYASSTDPVVIEGEAGVGKSLLAKLLHFQGSRAEGPFISVDCARLPEPLAEAELFGVERGAYTDARARRIGLIEQANGGTLVLDEVADLPDTVQTALLHPVEEGRLRRVGGREDVPIDVRIVTLSRRPLTAAAEARVFRQDLLFRLKGAQTTVPPLRERLEDVPALATHFLASARAEFGRRVDSFSPTAMNRLLEHDWSGNVRELRNAVRAAVLYCRGRRLLPAHFEDLGVADSAAVLRIMPEQLRHVLESTGWNRSLAAQILRISRPTLRALIRRYRLAPQPRPTPQQ